MKIFGLSIIFMTFIGCIEYTVEENVSAYKEALLRSRNVYTVDKNIDLNNDINLVFNTSFENQLVEINIESSKMNSSSYTVANNETFFKNKKINIPNPPEVSIGDLKVLLNGTDITSCLISECNSTDCTDAGSSISSFTGNFDSKKMYLNLTKIDSTCNEFDLGVETQVHKLTLQEGNSTISGGRIKAQVIVYNRTLNINKITKAFEQ